MYVKQLFFTFFINIYIYEIFYNKIGIKKSPSMLIGYLMKKEKKDFKAAYEFLKQKSS